MKVGNPKANKQRKTEGGGLRLEIKQLNARDTGEEEATQRSLSTKQQPIGDDMNQRSEGEERAVTRRGREGRGWKVI